MKLRSRTISVLGAIVTLASAGGLVALYAPSDARAAGETDSAVTVKWAGDNGELQQFQPSRDDVAPGGRYENSGFWDDFKDLQVTVSQTKGLTDQGITLTASGMAQSMRESFLPGSQNFLQVMQCWGDPDASDFASTCQWGALSGFETAKSTDAATSGAFGGGGFADATLNRGEGDGRVPFRTVTGQVQEPETITLPGESGSTVTTQGLDRYFSASTTNELVRVPFGSDRTATATFVAQSAAAQPYLGCGNPESQAGERCWLVIVPRGSHSTNLPGAERCAPREGAGHGEAGYNLSSPIASACGAWSNRIVVPLDFSNPFVSCPAGTSERRIVGSELLADAMSSWQPVLCNGDDGSTFSLTTNAGDLVRSQLLTGAAGLAVVAEPLTESTIANADPALLEDADLGYGPVANSAVTIGFLLEERDGRTARDLKLTPRLVAKLLTQSYTADRAGEIPGVKALSDITADEEWKALGNPTDLNPQVVNGAWVVVGPQGDDAFRSLWEYVLADADAVAFLKGSPDPWGTTVNPYYLPPKHSEALGGGADLLSSPIDTFPRQDQTIYPVNPDDPELPVQLPNYQKQVLDSTAMFPYSTTLTANAERIARADSRYTRAWDPQKLVGVASIGAFVPADPALPGRIGGRLVFGPTSAPAAEQYGLTTASLAQPLSSSTKKQTVATAREFVPYDDDSVAAGIAAHTTDTGTGLGTVDLSELPDGAYPLAATLYAAANLNAVGLNLEARQEYAHFVTYAATDGNVRTGDRGGLPEGYVPLTAEQQDAALELAERLTTMPDEPDPSGAPDGSDGGAGDGTGGSGSGDAADGSDDPADTSATVPIPEGGDDPAADGPPSDPGADGGPGADPTTTQTEAAATQDTAPLAASVALGGTLVAGLAGMVGAPFLMRRRDVTG
ncbi:hypothetical protein ACFS27_26175 [Promicromonospora vindobonensis]|uniref:PBP domain-containing protein n=1 Tax=Promicromonospora vindobonensis TaxID=195748 RepID=A0ABW5VZW5_9MICO